MKLENAELKNIEKIAAISKAAFDSDINVGACEADRPPDYDSVPSPKKQTKNTREKPNEKNDKYDIKLLYSTAFIPRFA